MTPEVAAAEVENDPQKYLWFAVYLLIIAVIVLPLFGLRVPLFRP
jgi:hypothetical protein